MTVSTGTWRAVVVDDHPLLAAALREALVGAGGQVDVLAPGPDLEPVLDLIATSPVACAIIDLGLPIPGGGRRLVERLAGRGMRVVVLTGETDRWLWAEAAHAGARVVLSKGEPLLDIVDVIVRVASGEDVRPAARAQLRAEYEHLAEAHRQRAEVFEALSAREQVILAGLMEGESVQRLAERDFVSVQTVRTQVKSLLRKLDVSSQLEAVALAHRLGWTRPTDRS